VPLTHLQVKQFLDDGFLIVENVFTKYELQPALTECRIMVDSFIQRLHAAGKISNSYNAENFFQRLHLVEKEFSGAALLFLYQTEIGPRLAELWCSTKLLAILEQFLGPNIAGHPIFAIRPKLPATSLFNVPWHQDTAYLLPEAENTDQVTCWIPFCDVDLNNGCLQYLKGGHRSRQVFKHHIQSKVGDRRSPYIYIEEPTLPSGTVFSCEMTVGSVLFHTQHSPHRSLDNLSDKIRWSVDFRYQSPLQPTGLQGDSWKLLTMRRSDDPKFSPDIHTWLEDKNRKRRADYFGQSGYDEFEIDAISVDKTIERWA
jgi:hypothetical protein